jgi:hypothetical protein
MRRLLVGALLACCGVAMGAETAPAVALGHSAQYSLTSAKIGQKYDLFVSLPHDYSTSGKAYPVLYVLDGWHFPLMAFIQENNFYSKRMPPVIIVNISQGDGPDLADLRRRDFAPTGIPQFPGSGHAADFLDFLENEIIPFADHTFRTVKGDRALLGHAIAGEFAIYAFLQRPALFQRIVAASPGLFWDDDVLIKSARVKLATGLATPVRLYLSSGDDDPVERQVAKSTADFVALLDELKPAKLDYRYTLFPGESHDSVRFPSFPAGLYWVYRP